MNSNFMRNQLLSLTNTANPEYEGLTLKKIYRLVGSVSRGFKLTYIASAQPELVRMDIVALIQFLCVHGVLKRVHKFPYYQQGLAHIQGPEDANAIELFNGRRTLDEICIRCHLSESAMEAKIAQEPAVCVVEK